MHSTPQTVVTGGAGFLGSHVCAALLERGTPVVCVDNFLTSAPGNLAGIRDHPQFRLVECDVSEGLRISGPVDTVIHLASPASPADYLRYPVETLDAGSAGTKHALEVAAESRARFVLTSTSEVYGDPLQHPQREDYWGNVNPIGPRGVYDESKRFAEALTFAFRKRHGVDTGIVRLFNSYGPRMRPNDGRAIPTFTYQALSGEPITVAGDGSQTRSLCYVEDTVRGILAMVASSHSGPINIGGDDEISMLELAERIRSATGSASGIVFVDLPENDPKVRRPDVTLARRDLSWEPQVSLADGLARTARWFAGQQRRAGNGHVHAEDAARSLSAASSTSST